MRGAHITYPIFTLNYENQGSEVVLCFFDQPDIYELQAKTARDSQASPRSIWRDLLLSIKFDLQLTTARESVPLREPVIYAETW